MRIQSISPANFNRPKNNVSFGYIADERTREALKRGLVASRESRDRDHEQALLDVAFEKFERVSPNIFTIYTDPKDGIVKGTFNHEYIAEQSRLQNERFEVFAGPEFNVHLSDVIKYKERMPYIADCAEQLEGLINGTIKIETPSPSEHSPDPEDDIYTWLFNRGMI